MTKKSKMDLSVFALVFAVFAVIFYMYSMMSDRYTEISLRNTYCRVATIKIEPCIELYNSIIPKIQESPFHSFTARTEFYPKCEALTNQHDMCENLLIEFLSIKR